jgi:hypothetical protein
VRAADVHGEDSFVCHAESIVSEVAFTERVARLSRRPGRLGGWCGVLSHTREDLRKTERGAAGGLRRLGARAVRLVFEALVLVVLAVAEVDMLRHRAANALAAPPKH